MTPTQSSKALRLHAPSLPETLKLRVSSRDTQHLPPMWASGKLSVLGEGRVLTILNVLTWGHSSLMTETHSLIVS